MWGTPADVATVVGGETFDVVLDNNGKDLDTVRSAFILIIISDMRFIRIFMDGSYINMFLLGFVVGTGQWWIGLKPPA